MSDEIQELMETAAFGEDVREFLESPIGIYLIKTADEERDRALDELKQADPENPKHIRELQNRVWRAESIQSWLAKVIMAGGAAMNMLDSSSE